MVLKLIEGNCGAQPGSPCVLPAGSGYSLTQPQKKWSLSQFQFRYFDRGKECIDTINDFLVCLSAQVLLSN